MIENINELIDDIVSEVSFRTDSGLVDFRNGEHIYILSEVLTEMGLGGVKDELISALMEADEEGKFKNPILNKRIDYEGGDGEKRSGLVGNLLRLKDDEPGRIAAEKLVPEKGTPERDELNKELGSEGQPTGDTDAESGDGGTQAVKEPETGTALKDPAYQNRVKNEKEIQKKLDANSKSEPDDEERIETDKIVNNVNVVPKNGSVSDVDDEFSDGDVKQKALEYGTKNPDKFTPAPGNASSMTAEIFSGEAMFHLRNNPNMSNSDLETALYNQIANTPLASELTSDELIKTGPNAGKSKELLKLVKSIARSGRVKWERNEAGIDRLKSESKLSDPTTTRNYYGHQDSIQRQIKLIENSNGPFYTMDGIEVPKDVLLNFIKNSGGGENPSDTSTITVDGKGRAMVSFHSDKLATSDIQANSTPNQEAENAKQIVETSDLQPQYRKQANDIIEGGKRELSEKEDELQRAANGPARELANSNISQILNDIKSNKGITGNAKVSSKLKSLLSRGKPHPNLLPYLSEEKPPYSEEVLLKAFFDFTGDDNRSGTMTGDQIKLLYRSAKQQGYDISKDLGRIREESLQIQRNTHRKLNEISINLPNGDTKKLGDYIEAKNIVDKLHISVIDGEKSKGVGAYPGLFSVNMGGTIVEAKQLKGCLSSESTDDFISHFEVGTPEKEDEVIRSKETGQITGRNIFVYAITKDGKRIKVAYKTQRSKSGESGKLQTTYQWDTEIQDCFKKNQ